MEIKVEFPGQKLYPNTFLLLCRRLGSVRGIINSFSTSILGKPQKKVLLLMAGPLRGNLFFQRSKIAKAIKPGGGGGLNGPAIKRRTI